MATTPKRRRSRGTGGIIRQVSGFYAYQYVDANGTRKTKSLRTKDRREAEARAKEHAKAVSATDRAEVLLHAAKARQIIRSRDLAMSDVWPEFLATKPTASAGTLGNYERSLRDFAAWLEVNRPSIRSFTEIDDETARDYLAGLWATGISGNTYNYRRNALGCVTKALSGPYHIESNPWTRPEFRKAEAKQSREALTSEQTTRLLELLDAPADSNPHPGELRTVVLLCLYAGMRLKDACLLQWHSVDMESGRISYTPAKTAQKAKKAVVPILPPLRLALAHLGASAEPPGDVLPAVAEMYRRNPDGIQKPLVALVQEAAGDDGKGRQGRAARRKVERSVYGAHSLRHTFASFAAMAGAKPAYLALMLGDNITTVQKYYVHVGFGMALADGFDSLPRMIEAKVMVEPERARLRRLADDLPMAKVREVLALLEASDARDSKALPGEE